MVNRIYPTALQGRNIRLLRLFPANENEQVHCNLVEVPLDDIQPYEALSYVWGDPTVTETIICNGYPIDVTINLASFLRRVRHTPSSCNRATGVETLDPKSNRSLLTLLRARTLWADAICINQQDLGERSRQVQLMGELYTRANKVLVWLGGMNGSHISDAVAAINFVARSQEYQPEMHSTRHSLGTTATFADLQHCIQERGWLRAWEGLSSIFSCPWWTRVWCVQEAVLAKDVLMLCGEEKLSGDTIAIFAGWYLDLEWSDTESCGFYGVGLFNVHLRFNYHLQQSDPILMLNGFRDLQATNPRDKVYGLLGLIKQETLSVDYEKTVAQVYTDVASNSIRERNDLYVLSYVIDNLFAEDSNSFPSWVPRWDRPEKNWAIWPEKTAMSAGKSHSNSRIFDITQDGVLTVRGVLFDEIKIITPIIAHGQPSVMNDEVIRLFLETFYHATPSSTQRPNEVIATTLVGGYTLHLATAGDNEFTHLDNLGKPQGDQFMDDFEAFAKAVLGDECTTPTAEGDAEAYSELAWSVCKGRRLFLTDKGCLGLGPACAEQGDCVAVLTGGKVPYVLRAGKDSADTFSFGGECFIYDIMDGQAYTMGGAEGVAERVFTIR